MHDVSFEIGDGEFFALIGHTGSGKTTIAMHLNALLQPASGRVLVDGQDINQNGADRREVRRKVGMVFQYPEYQWFQETVTAMWALARKTSAFRMRNARSAWRRRWRA